MNSPKTNRSAPQSGFNLHDILFVLFKHKWKILFLTLLGFGAAGVIAYKDSLSPTYETKAKLLVRYVVERNTSDPDAPEPMDKGRPSMKTEIAILTSWDLAVDTAEKIGPDKLLPDRPVPPTPTNAAGPVAGGLKAVAEGTVIELSYRHPDPDLSVEVLEQLIQSYFEKHLEIHRSTNAFAQVAKQADQARSALRTTEDEINRLKSESGVLSIEATIAEFETRRQVVIGSLLAAESALAEQRAKMTSLEKSYASQAPDSSVETPENPAATPEDETIRRSRAEALAESRDLAARLSLMQQERNTILLRRPSSHPMIASLDSQIKAVRQRGLDLIERYPETANLLRAPAEGGAAAAPSNSIEDERALLLALEARVETITRQAKEIEGEVQELSSLGFKLAELERNRRMEEEKFHYFQTSLEKARVDEALDPSKIPNISVIQSPSAPVKSLEEGTKKVLIGVAGAGLALGLALAFLIEFVIDRRVTRPVDIQTRLQLPLMMSIPYIRSRDGITKLIGREPGAGFLLDTGDQLSPSPPNGHVGGPVADGRKGKLVRIEEDHFITPFARAIHDRILFNFEINNITHKPKLVALTGLSEGAGCSTIAAGLAKEFSDNASLKVLLVDLNSPSDGQQERRHPAESLYRALEVSKGPQFRQSSRNLYFASAPTRRGRNDKTALTPVALHGIMPHLIGSDFDYIFFDMPPMDQTSPTIAMAGFMDKVLLVLDAENTTSDSLNWAYKELEKGRADVSCIFNKARSYAPRWVQGEV